MADIDFQDISTVQSDRGPKAKTIDCANTIAPTTLLTKLTATGVTLQTIVPPVAGDHILYFVSIGGVVLTGTSGNIVTSYTTVVNRPIAMIYDSAQGKYYVAAVV